MTKKYFEVMYKKAGKQINKAYQFTDDVKVEDKLGSFVSSYWNHKISNLKITNLTDNIHYDYDKIETLKHNELLGHFLIFRAHQVNSGLKILNTKYLRSLTKLKKVNG